jgi:hypothetical protein
MAYAEPSGAFPVPQEVDCVETYSAVIGSEGILKNTLKRNMHFSYIDIPPLLGRLNGVDEKIFECWYFTGWRRDARHL